MHRLLRRERRRRQLSMATRPQPTMWRRSTGKRTAMTRKRRTTEIAKSRGVQTLPRARNRRGGRTRSRGVRLSVPGKATPPRPSRAMLTRPRRRRLKRMLTLWMMTNCLRYMLCHTPRRVQPPQLSWVLRQSERARLQRLLLQPRPPRVWMARTAHAEMPSALRWRLSAWPIYAHGARHGRRQPRVTVTSAHPPRRRAATATAFAAGRVFARRRCAPQRPPVEATQATRRSAPSASSSWCLTRVTLSACRSWGSSILASSSPASVTTSSLSTSTRLMRLATLRNCSRRPC
mmetsp:Transcript_14170/g.59243  ORF Transcript_14170/g.59243 Transcript_14170/m.59243 type:complete len:290 (-) Transcript_14170:539-1408(-)